MAIAVDALASVAPGRVKERHSNRLIAPSRQRETRLTGFAQSRKVCDDDSPLAGRRCMSLTSPANPTLGRITT